MTTPLDITDFIYNTGTLTIAPGDTTAVFSGTSLSANIKDGDTLCAGGVKVPIKTVTDDTHAELFTAWDGTSVTGATYVILKDSMLRDNAVQIGYDTAAFLSFLDNTTIWYVVEGAAPDPSVGEDTNRALKTNVTPWQQWLKTGGIWVEQAGSPGGPGATILSQTTEPDTNHPDNSLWIDSDSADLDVYALTGSPPAWADTGINLKGATGPASWAAPAAWVTGTAYVAAPPASAVTQGGETYVCLIAHTSGSFSTDLAAGKWIKVAAKGADGTGVGDVVGPSSAVDSHIVLFDTISGKAIKDSGKAVSDFATAAQGAKADSALQNASAFATAAQGAKADSAVQSVVGGTNVTVDATDPHNPIVSVSGSVGIPDTDRRNILLERIYQSKSYGGYRRFINAIADGYKASDGINSGSSSNYVLNTSAGNFAPSMIVTSSANPTQILANGGLTMIDRTTPVTNGATVSAAGAYLTSPGTVVAKILKRNSTGNYDIVVSESYSHPGGGWFDHTLTTPYTVPGTGVYYVGFYTSNSNADSSTSSISRAYKTGDAIGTGQTFTEDSTGTTTAARAIYGFNNMTVVTSSQTADATVSSGRVLVEYDNTSSPTLNTDLTVEVTCDGGAHWTAASLSAVGAGQNGRKVAETADQSCTSGTSFAARIKTLNNKSVPIYGVAWTVH